MTQQDIEEMLRSPEQIAPRMIPELHEFLREFPYAQSFRMLYLRALRNASDFRYDAELPLTSLYAADRVALAELMRKEPVAVSVPTPAVHQPVPSEKEVKNTLSNQEKYEEKAEKNAANGGSPILDIVAELEQLAPAKSAPTKKTNKKHDSIIDNFLKEDDHEPIRVTEDQHSDNQEIEDKTKGQGSDQFYTETLAKIYIKQKKYEQAVKIFQKLVQKNPGKSVYFADQIRFFERLIENL